MWVCGWGGGGVEEVSSTCFLVHLSTSAPWPVGPQDLASLSESCERGGLSCRTTRPQVGTGRVCEPPLLQGSNPAVCVSQGPGQNVTPASSSVGTAAASPPCGSATGTRTAPTAATRTRVVRRQPNGFPFHQLSHRGRFPSYTMADTQRNNLSLTHTHTRTHSILCTTF